MTAVIITLTVIAYIFVSGMFAHWFYRSRTQACAATDIYCYHDHNTAAGIAGFLWPFVIPFTLGEVASKRLTNEERERRRKTRHDRRMEHIAAENKGRLLEIEKVKLNIEFLQKNGVNAAVPGLFEGDQ